MGRDHFLGNAPGAVSWVMGRDHFLGNPHPMPPDLTATYLNLKSMTHKNVSPSLPQSFLSQSPIFIHQFPQFSFTSFPSFHSPVSPVFIRQFPQFSFPSFTSFHSPVFSPHSSTWALDIPQIIMQSRSHETVHKVGRWEVRVLPTRGVPCYEINGVRYSKVEWREIVTRVQDKKTRGLGGLYFCSECKMNPCVAETAGSTAVLGLARRLRKTSPTVHTMHSRCLQLLVATEIFQAYMLENESGEIPCCARLWVDARCCMNLKR